MPLIHSGSDQAFKTNLHALFHEVGQSPHVKSRDQALAIAYAVKRRGKAGGGGLLTAGPQPGSQFPNTNVTGFGHEPVTGAVNPSPQPYSGAMPSMPNQGAPAAAPSQPFSTGTFTPMPGQGGGDFGHLPVTGIGAPGQNAPQPSIGQPPGSMPSPGGTPPSWPTLSMPAMPQTGAANPFPNFNATGQGNPSGGLPGYFANPALAAAWRARRGYAFGGAPAPWQVRSEARNMLHSGPIMSAVPGRTDRHNMSLASGAYVIPSQAVSHLGQNNTMAGFKVLNSMFGAGGPYGSGAMKLGHGAGAPKPPAMMKPFSTGGAYDQGGGRGDNTGNPVEVVTAGGEYVVPPHVVAGIGGGDVNHGHEVLDAWVNKIKEDHIRTLRKLPGPAKS